MKKDSIWSNKTKLLGRGLCALLAFHIGTQIYHKGHEIYNTVNPSEVRTYFEETHGIPIRGQYKYVEGSPRDIRNISAIVDEEMKQKPFDVDSIGIESEEYIHKNFVQQIAKVFTGGHNGYYFMNDVYVKENVRDSTVVHEIKHAKVFDILETNPEFRDRWVALTLDENGNSLYEHSNDVTYVLSRINLVGKLSHDDEEKPTSGENLELGFVSDYARVNFHEDVAELATMVYDLKNRIVTPLPGAILGPNPNERIIGKVELLQEYGLIPEDLIDYLKVRESQSKIYGRRGTYYSSEIPQFLEAAEDFLEENPDSYFRNTILLDCVAVKRITADKTNPNSPKTREAREMYSNLLRNEDLNLDDLLITLYGLSYLYKDNYNDYEGYRKVDDTIDLVYDLNRSDADLTLDLQQRAIDDLESRGIQI